MITQKIGDFISPQDLEDELQPAANWIVKAIPDCQISDIQSRLMLGFNRAKRLYDCALEASNAQANEAGDAQTQTTALTAWACWPDGWPQTQEHMQLSKDEPKAYPNRICLAPLSKSVA